MQEPPFRCDPQTAIAIRGSDSERSGIINSLVVLENVDRALLLAHGEAVRTFVNDSAIRSIGPQTQEHIKSIEARLSGA